MSAYQVSPATIDLMVSAAIEFKAHARLGGSWQTVVAENAQAFGAMLWQANADSIVARYDDRMSAPGRYTFSRYIEVKPGAAFGCTRCFDYQACEVSNYGATDAREFVFALYKAIGDRLVGENSPWGVHTADDIATKGYGRKVYTPREQVARMTVRAPAGHTIEGMAAAARKAEANRAASAYAAGQARAAELAKSADPVIAKAARDASATIGRLAAKHTPKAAKRRAAHPALSRFAMVRPYR